MEVGHQPLDQGLHLSAHHSRIPEFLAAGVLLHGDVALSELEKAGLEVGVDEFGWGWVLAVRAVHRDVRALEDMVLRSFRLELVFAVPAYDLLLSLLHLCDLDEEVDSAEEEFSQHGVDWASALAVLGVDLVGMDGDLFVAFLA